MEQSVASLDQCLSKRLSEFQQRMDLKFTEMDKRIFLLDKTHDENETNIQRSLDTLYSEHEMFATTTQQDFKEITQSLDTESTNLTVNFDQQLNELKIHLEKVSHELSSSKTDRKILAKLLATMAMNLEDDHL